MPPTCPLRAGQTPDPTILRPAYAAGRVGPPAIVHGRIPWASSLETDPGSGKVLVRAIFPQYFVPLLDALQNKPLVTLLIHRVPTNLWVDGSLDGADKTG